jgi:hypothetical protein
LDGAADKEPAEAKEEITAEDIVLAVIVFVLSVVKKYRITRE